MFLGIIFFSGMSGHVIIKTLDAGPDLRIEIKSKY